MAEIQRLPLTVKPSNRDETTDRDAKIINGYVEQVSEKDVQVYKRPGYAVYNTGHGAAAGRGMYVWNGDLYTVFGTTLYKNGSSLGTVNGTAMYSWSSCMGQTPSLMLQNGAAAYYYNTTTGLVNIPMSTDKSVFGTITNASAVVTDVTPNTTGLTVGDKVSGDYVPGGATIASVDSANQFTLSAAATGTAVGEALTFNAVVLTGDTTLGSAIIKNITPNTTGLFVGMTVTGAGIPILSSILSVDSSTQVTLNNPATATATGVSFAFTTAFPPNQVQGVAYLDGYMNVMTQDAVIYSSEPNQPSTWYSGTYIAAAIEADPGVYLTKQLVYLVAFKKYSVEMFYDAGNTVGSPLLPEQGTKVTLGCRHANSISQMEGTLFWVSQARDGGTAVWLMDGMKPAQISTPPIERLLQQADYTTVYSWCARVAGHKYYCITLPASNLSLVFDLTSRQWYQWKDTNGNYLPYVSASFTGDNQAIFQHESNGKLYELEITNYTDEGNLITFDLYTPNYDAGTKQRKYVKSLDIVGDQTNGSIMRVRVSDDDYQSWSNFRTLDLSKKRAYIMDCGTFRRRAYHFRHACNTPLRVKAVELLVDPGTL